MLMWEWTTNNTYTIQTKIIVATDLSKSIFIAAKNYKNKFNKIPIDYLSKY